MKIRSYLLSGLLSISLFIGITHTAKAQTSEADVRVFRRIEQPLGLKIAITATGVGLIGLELWWFLLSKARFQTAKVADGVQAVNITVDGGYSPDQIVVQAGKPVRLKFLRKDPSSCLEQIIIPDFNQALDLPLNQEVTVEIFPKEAGNYPFHCGMNMFRGTLTVDSKLKSTENEISQRP